MNKRLKELAEQAGLDPCVFYDNLLRISDFVELVRQDEREKCAKLYEDLHDCDLGIDPYDKASAAELRRLHEVNQEWERKAATWLASPEASARLGGYRGLAQRVNKLEAQNQELVEALEMCINNPWREGTMEYDVLMQVAKAALAKARGTE